MPILNVGVDLVGFYRRRTLLLPRPAHLAAGRHALALAARRRAEPRGRRGCRASSSATRAASSPPFRSSNGGPAFSSRRSTSACRPRSTGRSMSARPFFCSFGSRCGFFPIRTPGSRACMSSVCSSTSSSSGSPGRRSTGRGRRSHIGLAVGCLTVRPWPRGGPPRGQRAAAVDFRVSLPDDWTRLRVTNQILMKREPSPEVMAAFLAKAKEGKEDEAQLAAFLDKDLADPLNLSGRNLRRADLSRSRMPGLVLDSNTHLEEADLSGTNLTKAVMSGASLQGASLDRASLRGASLTNLWRAWITAGTDLALSDIRGSSLDAPKDVGAMIDEALDGIDDPNVAERVKRGLTESLRVTRNPWLPPIIDGGSMEERAHGWRRRCRWRLASAHHRSGCLRRCSQRRLAPLFCSDHWIAQGLLGRASSERISDKGDAARRWPDSPVASPIRRTAARRSSRSSAGTTKSLLSDLAGCRRAPTQALQPNRRYPGARTASPPTGTAAPAAAVWARRHGRRPPLPIDLGPAVAQAFGWQPRLSRGMSPQVGHSFAKPTVGSQGE